MFLRYSKCGDLILSKWSIGITILCGVILFAMLFSLITFQSYPDGSKIVTKDAMNTSNDEYKQYWDDLQNIQFSFENGLNQCNMTLSDINANKIDDTIMEHIATSIDCKAKELKLKLDNIKYPHETILRQWLHADVKITDLIITSNNTLTISPNSFSGFQFKHLKTLSLSNITITENKVILQNTDTRISQPISFTGLFRKFNETLTKLNIKNMHGFNIMEVIGNIKLPALKTLNLENCSLRDTTLSKFDFVHTRNISWLRFFDCKIKQIGVDAFYFIRNTIQEIDLRNNRLMRLPEGLLDSMLNKRYQLIFYLDGNPWMCSCNDISNTFDQAACLSKPNCGIESVTNPYGLAAKNYRNKETIDVQCVDYEDSTLVETIQVQCRDHDMEITAVNQTAVKIEFETDLPNFVLLWFNDSILRSSEEHVMTAEDINCMTPLSQTMFIEDLTGDLTYTFCIMENTSVTMSPFNCAAFYLPPKDDGENNSMWISNEHKTVVIIFAVGIFIVFVSIGVITGVWLIRRNPMWLRDSRNLIMTGSKNSFVDTNSSGFASDSMRVINSVEDYRGYLEQRRHSDTSLKSLKGYEVALNPSRFDIIKSRLEKSQYENKYYSENMPKLPPPQPPQSQYHANLYMAQKFETNSRPKLTRCIDDFNLDGLYAKCGGTFTK